MAAKAPYMPFYVGDWLSSPNVDCMSLEEQGAFMRLLCHCWASGNASIPDDDKLLAGMSRMGKKWFKKNAKGNAESLIRKCFVPHPTIPNCLTNGKILELHQERLEYVENQSANGKKSAEKRRNKKNSNELCEIPESREYAPKSNDGSTVVIASLEPSDQPNVNSSSSSSKTSSKREENLTKEELLIDENNRLREVISQSLTFPSGPSGRCQQWIEIYPRKSHPRDVPQEWNNAIYEISIEHECDEGRAADILDEITREYARSPSAKEPPEGMIDYRQTPANWLKSGQYKLSVNRKAWLIPHGNVKQKSGFSNESASSDLAGIVYESA